MACRPTLFTPCTCLHSSSAGSYAPARRGPRCWSRRREGVEADSAIKKHHYQRRVTLLDSFSSSSARSRSASTSSLLLLLPSSSSPPRDRENTYKDLPLSRDGGIPIYPTATTRVLDESQALRGGRTLLRLDKIMSFNNCAIVFHGASSAVAPATWWADCTRELRRDKDKFESLIPETQNKPPDTIVLAETDLSFMYTPDSIEAAGWKMYTVCGPSKSGSGADANRRRTS